MGKSTISMGPFSIAMSVIKGKFHQNPFNHHFGHILGTVLYIPAAAAPTSPPHPRLACEPALCTPAARGSRHLRKGAPGERRDCAGAAPEPLMFMAWHESQVEWEKCGKNVLNNKDVSIIVWLINMQYGHWGTFKTMHSRIPSWLWFKMKHYELGIRNIEITKTRET